MRIKLYFVLPEFAFIFLAFMMLMGAIISDYHEGADILHLDVSVDFDFWPIYVVKVADAYASKLSIFCGSMVTKFNKNLTLKLLRSVFRMSLSRTVN